VQPVLSIGSGAEPVRLRGRENHIVGDSHGSALHVDGEACATVRTPLLDGVGEGGGLIRKIPDRDWRKGMLVRQD
jgi:hypothetical protein